MRLRIGRVTPGRKARPQQLATELCHGATLLARFAASGVVGEVQRTMPLSRRGGFGSVELLAAATVFLCAGAQSSLRDFLSRMRAAFSQIAAIVDRRTLPSSASLSRTLSDLDPDIVGKLSDKLLAMPAGLDELLRRPDVQHRDAHGHYLHVFDFDPSTRAFRERDLVEGDEFPEPRRRARGVPGHTGRKRGEIRQQDHLLRHAGSGLWAYYRLNSTGGSASTYLAAAAGVAAQWMARLGCPADSALIRTDGEFGHLAALVGCTAHGLHYLTRIARYHLFERPEVVAGLGGATWHRVPGSERKEAAEFGTLTLHDSDGKYEPVPCRVVVTRFATDRDEPRHGVLRDGYQYETFATTLKQDAWPAADVAALYAGRSAIENGFAQHDRAYDIDRTFSYSPAGQQFFVMVALLLWNEHVCIGAAAQGPVAVAKQQVRPEEPPSADPPPSLEAPTAVAATDVATAVVAPEDPPGEALASDSGPPAPVPAEIPALVSEAAQGRTLLRGWAIEPQSGLLRCPQGNGLQVCHAELATEQEGKRSGQNRIRFRTAVGQCDGCPLRASCFASAKQNTYKIVTWAVPAELAARVRDALRAARAEARPHPVRRRSLPTSPPPATSSEPLLFQPAEAPLPPGRWRPQSPAFSPARTHTLVARALGDLIVELHLVRRPRERPPRDGARASPLAATRLRWTELEHRRRSRMMAEVTIRAPRSVHRMLRWSAE